MLIIIYNCSTYHVCVCFSSEPYAYKKIVALCVYPSIYKTLHVFSGYYQICVNNIHSRFVSKLVHFYIVTMVEAEWTKYVEEIEELKTAVENFTVKCSFL